MSSLIYDIDVPSVKDALFLAKELEEVAAIKPVMICDNGKDYKYDSDAAGKVIDGDVELNDYLIENGIE